MKKIIVLIIISVLLFMPKLSAACDDINLNDLAESFKAGYVEDSDIETKLDDGSYSIHRKEYAYLLLFTPYSDDLKVIVNDSISGKSVEAKYNDFRGTYLVGSEIHYKNKIYTVNVYGNENSACPNQLLKTLSFTIPPFNEYSMYSYCRDNKDEDVCKMMEDTSGLTMTEYNKIVSKNTEKKKIEKMNFFQKVIYYFLKYWYFVVIPVLVISVYYFISIKMYKKKVSKR